MNNEEQLRQALNYLSNNWRWNPLLREAFGSMLAKLNEGTENDLMHAKVIEEYLSYPGSDEALVAAHNLHLVLKVSEARKVINLDPQKAAESYPTKLVTNDSNLMMALVARELNRSIGIESHTEFEIENKVMSFFSHDMDERTIKKKISELQIRAKEIADFMNLFFKSNKENKPL